MHSRDIAGKKKYTFVLFKSKHVAIFYAWFTSADIRISKTTYLTLSWWQERIRATSSKYTTSMFIFLVLSVTWSINYKGHPRFPLLSSGTVVTAEHAHDESTRYIPKPTHVCMLQPLEKITKRLKHYNTANWAERKDIMRSIINLLI